jgi:hypothetical protein
MNKGMIFLGAIFVLFLLNSCTSTVTVTPKGFSGSAQIFKVNNAGTVVVKGYNKEQPMHWVFVECENELRGCYMRCQGPVNKCKSIAKKSELEVSHIETNHAK